MDETDLKLLKAAQNGFRITKRPFLALGKEVGISEEETIERLRNLEKDGIIRRFSATIGHRALGITANAMIIWKVPANQVIRVGEIFASMDEVTHCYERKIAPDWPYNLYTMVHSRNRDDCLIIAEKLSQISGIGDYRVLFSEKEYKKISARI